MSVSLDNLNKEQLDAVKQVDGPVMVFAGAGTGKTRTLTYRIAYMLDDLNINARNICAITFTNKATNEMRNRLIDLVGQRSYNLTISTFHALCARILRVDIDKLGYMKSFEIIDDEDQTKFIKDLLEDHGFDKKEFAPKRIKNMINRRKCLGIKGETEVENRIFDLYEQRMKDLNLLDFEDLLLKVYDLFTNHKEVLEKYQNRFKYVLVDEFQDTNTIQYEIAKMLTVESRNLFVVGDDDQSIYSFRGTNYDNIKYFQSDFPEFKKYFLTKNYRSTQTILDGAHSLISNNIDREEKKLVSDVKGDSSDVNFYAAIDESDEAEHIVYEIKKLLRNGVNTKDIAVLYRSNVLSRNFELACVRNKIAYKIYGGVSYLRRMEVKDILAYLKLICNNNDVYSFTRIVNVPSRTLGKATIDKVLEIKKANKCSIFEAIENCDGVIASSKLQKLREFKQLILELAVVLNDDVFSLVDLFNKIITKTNYLEIYKDDEDKLDRYQNLEELKSVLSNIENNGEVATKREKLMSAFDEAVLSDDKLQNQKEKVDGVTLSTIHSVKGLEYDYVFVTCLEEDLFPSNFSKYDDDLLEEERRVCYVAVTRAKKKLHLTYATKRMIYGKTNSTKKSRFLLEYQEAFKKEEIKEVKAVKPKFNYENKSQYSVGDKVNHGTYGLGIIVSIDGEFGQICFTQKGQIKKFMLSHPSITRAE